MRLKENEVKDLAYAQLTACVCFPAALSVLPLTPFLSVLPDSCHSLHTMDQDYYEGTDCLSPIAADGDRTEEFEYEVRDALDITTYLLQPG